MRTVLVVVNLLEKYGARRPEEGGSLFSKMYWQYPTFCSIKV